jgi:hypothetical protein
MKFINIVFIIVRLKKKTLTPKPQATKIALNQINKLVIFGDFVYWCQKKESKVPVLNNGCNPVLSMSSK